MTFLSYSSDRLAANNDLLSIEITDSNSRSTYLVIFSVFLLISVVSTLFIYYCIRYKRKYFFDAAGRKFIVSTCEAANKINKLMEIIQFDNKQLLEEEVITNSIGIFHLRNNKGQNLLHQCAFYGARDCLLYLIKFELINPNDKDDQGNIPLDYVLKIHNEDIRKNREMFLWLSAVTNLEEGRKYTESFNDWQKYIHQKYVKNAFLRRYVMTETSI